MSIPDGPLNYKLYFICIINVTLNIFVVGGGGGGGGLYVPPKHSKCKTGLILAQIHLSSSVKHIGYLKTGYVTQFENTQGYL